MPRRSVLEDDYGRVIRKSGLGKRGRSTGRASFERLCSLVKENGNASWVQGEYEFLFPAGNGSFGRYLWRGREIYVTYAEALYLYERLALEKSGRQCATNGLLRNLRKRLGGAFLAEYLLPMEQMKREKRRRETNG
jgi:hypothetical protein